MERSASSRERREPLRRERSTKCQLPGRSSTSGLKGAAEMTSGWSAAGRRIPKAAPTRLPPRAPPRRRVAESRSVGSLLESETRSSALSRSPESLESLRSGSEPWGGWSWSWRPQPCTSYRERSVVGAVAALQVGSSWTQQAAVSEPCAARPTRPLAGKSKPVAPSAPGPMSQKAAGVPSGKLEATTSRSSRSSSRQRVAAACDDCGAVLAATAR
mmetsp:Transcript_38040/g.124452  ORF Transcript_38040/g.124452 Transcript_38040/m.124452 type:complete len:215 (+) Transcript_38040:892-1536(+)